jgi:hypothetical protein
VIPNPVDALLSTNATEEHHSRVLAWLLDPAGDHGLGRAFLDAVVDRAFPTWSLGPISEVKTEHRLEEGSWVDVAVLGDGQVFLVENKIRFSSNTEGQVGRYLAAARGARPDDEIRLVHLLPGPRKRFPHLETHGDDVAILFWADIESLLRSPTMAGALAEAVLPSVQRYCDLLYQQVAEGAALRDAYLEEAAAASAEDPARLDLVRAFIGFLEKLEYVRVQYKKGKTHWTVTGSVPRADAGVTTIVGCYANGRIWYQYGRLPEALGEEYRGMTFEDSTGGWREVWIETLPLEQTMRAIRTIATRASTTELPFVS